MMQAACRKTTYAGFSPGGESLRGGAFGLSTIWAVVPDAVNGPAEAGWPSTPLSEPRRPMPLLQHHWHAREPTFQMPSLRTPGLLPVEALIRKRGDLQLVEFALLRLRRPGCPPHHGPTAQSGVARVREGRWPY